MGRGSKGHPKEKMEFSVDRVCKSAPGYPQVLYGESGPLIVLIMRWMKT